MLKTPHKEASDSATFVKAGTVGSIEFEERFSVEPPREAIRKTDVYTMECTPVFVADEPRP